MKRSLFPEFDTLPSRDLGFLLSMLEFSLGGACTESQVTSFAWEHTVIYKSAFGVLDMFYLLHVFWVSSNHQTFLVDEHPFTSYFGFTRYQGFDPSPIVEALRYISIPKKPKNPLGSHSWMWPWLLSVLWPPQLAALRHRKWPSRNSWIFPLNMVIFHSYVKLPEGNYHGKHNYGKTINSMMFFQFVM